MNKKTQKIINFNRFVIFFPIFYIVVLGILFIPVPIDIRNPFEKYDVAVKVEFSLEGTLPGTPVADNENAENLKKALADKGYEDVSCAYVSLKDDRSFKKVGILEYIDNDAKPVFYGDIVDYKYSDGINVPIIDVKYVSCNIAIINQGRFPWLLLTMLILGVFVVLDILGLIIYFIINSIMVIVDKIQKIKILLFYLIKNKITVFIFIL